LSVLRVQKIIAILDDEAISEEDKPDVLRDALGSVLRESANVSGVSHWSIHAQ
jgi:hypothetical protein